MKKKRIEKKEQAKEEDVLICARCGEQIIGDYDYVKTRRRTEMYFHKGLTCKAKEVWHMAVIRSIRGGSAGLNEEDRLKIANLLVKAGYSVKIGYRENPGNRI